MHKKIYISVKLHLKKCSNGFKEKVNDIVTLLKEILNFDIEKE